MNTIRIRRMADYDRDVRREVAEVFVDGYYNELSYFTQDRNTLQTAFQDLFSPEVFYVAEVQGVIIGILACSHNGQRAMPVALTPLQDALGDKTGKLAYEVMKNEFNLALPYDDDTGYIECVATTEKARGKGVSTALMKHVMKELPYRRYVLEVANSNEAGLRLYPKLGFREIERKPEGHSEDSGFHERIYMEWSKPLNLNLNR
ncbi:N-acetyltransferase [Paenibacillus glucanolyticus]|uniref:GNAT family N-acetyltransferase n=1 Tax=Paenibacillus TaxID=44249 RepID=UPI0003E25D01|nr:MULTISPECIES: GNAT family N-acetyltransferase [Paenibacillus]ANA82769.1 acetyltransferase [Paenibacillus glucanolyticus]AVV58149.1 N-acetyltransferase [Paenibacillus glucanolyticus]ETT42901.1 GCN5-like N-acetyltransferase [Paenibacillus sp. FSL R5-808]MDH6670724.1 ribosomal protein S18 acetylase RimI-like enzyme [Paenibacillus sp. LBL]MPY17778.1 GNAT family N-acetyltransferase [Paenibacillus glucanolyticus]